MDFFLASLGEFGQKSFAPPKMLLHPVGILTTLKIRWDSKGQGNFLVRRVKS